MRQQPTGAPPLQSNFLQVCQAVPLVVAGQLVSALFLHLALLDIIDHLLWLWASGALHAFFPLPVMASLLGLDSIFEAPNAILEECITTHDESMDLIFIVHFALTYATEK